MHKFITFMGEKVMKELYVAAAGSGNGSMEAPLGSIAEAKKAAEASDEDVTVYLREGRYFLSDTVRFENVNGKKITFKAYNGEKVYFDGGIVLDGADAKPVSDKKIKDRIIDKAAAEKVLEIDLSDCKIKYAKYGTRGFRRAVVPSPNELYINTEPYDIARYPNKGDALIPIKTVIDSGSVPYNEEYDMRPATFRYEDSRCALWENAKGFYVSGLFKNCYADDTIEIAKIDTKEETMTTAIPHLSGFAADSYTSFFAVNLLEEIDIPGEYFIDSETKKVYFYPKNDVKDALIQISVLDTPMVSLKNCENITFSGITFENSRGTGAYIEDGNGCIFENCVFRNLGMVGVQIGKGATALPEGRHTAHGKFAPDVKPPVSESEIIGSWHEMLYMNAAWNNDGGKNHGIVNCEIYNTATGGIILSGGDRKTLDKAGNYVENCDIHNVNRLDRTYKAGVNIAGVGNRVSHCNIYDMPGFAVYLHGNDHIIEYNDIHDVITEVADAGAFYMGRDLTEVGNILRYNCFHDIGPKIKSVMGICAVYFDDYCSFNAVHGNYFINIGGTTFGAVFWNRGCDASVSRNVFVDCELPMRPHHYCMKGVRKELMNPESILNIRAFCDDENDLRGVDIRSEAYKKAYPYLYEVYEGTYSAGSNIWHNTVISDKENDFKDYKNGDLTLTDKSMALKWPQPEVYDTVLGIVDGTIAFDPIDFKTIGRQKA